MCLRTSISFSLTTQERSPRLDPFRALATSKFQLPVGLGKYNGLEGRLERRFRSDFGLRLAYTYSSSVGNTPQEPESNSGSAPNGRNYAAGLHPVISIRRIGWLRAMCTIRRSAATAILSGAVFSRTSLAGSKHPASTPSPVAGLSPSVLVEVSRAAWTPSVRSLLLRTLSVRRIS